MNAAKQLRVVGITDEHVAAVILSHAPNLAAMTERQETDAQEIGALMAENEKLRSALNSPAHEAHH